MKTIVIGEVYTLSAERIAGLGEGVELVNVTEEMTFEALLALQLQLSRAETDGARIVAVGALAMLLVMLRNLDVWFGAVCAEGSIL